MKFAPSTQEHRFLDRLLGEWLTTSAGGHEDYDPDDPAQRWTETVRPLGPYWVVAESRGAMPDGSQAQMVMSLGYDPRKAHYVGTWIGSMMDSLWVYRGWIEPDGNTLTLEAEGPSFSDPGKLEIYRDAITFLDPDHRTLTGSVRQPDGTFQTFMSNEMKRIG